MALPGREGAEQVREPLLEGPSDMPGYRVSGVFTICRCHLA